MSGRLGTPGIEDPVRAVSAQRSAYQGERGVSIANFRDVALSTPALRQRLRPGLLFRSANPWPASAKGAEALAQTGLRLVLDLRSTGEQAEGAAQDEAGDLWRRCQAGELRRVPVPLPNIKKKGKRLFQAADWGIRFQMIGSRLGLVSQDAVKSAVMPMIVQSGLLGLYVEDILQDSTEELRACLEALGGEGALPALIHCTAGKDRTGVLVALILASAGVAEEDIVEDYNISEEFIADIFDSSNVVAHSVANQFGAALQRCPRATMRATLEYIRTTHDSVSAYLEYVVGFDRAAQASLHSKLLLPGTSTTSLQQ